HFDFFPVTFVIFKVSKVRSHSGKTLIYLVFSFTFKYIYIYIYIYKMKRELSTNKNFFSI
ncbi:MAG: hypothetical protein MCS20_01620, partial [Candidatus Phytoplasma mali]|nr:hypothetical protein [Candidatus Phytoplasma australiense]MBZ7920094.1 hypothetical protein [Candidatus Karelsulcia muelleri]MCG7202092.1 hypothetical protein [Candidatus Phytoplasma mali]MCZ8632504.1 hypothetical protein [Spiroplasma sp. Tabriz.8]